MNKARILGVFILVLVLTLECIIAIPTFGSNYNFTSYLNEETLFAYNFSANVTDVDIETWNFSILSINSTFYPSQSSPAFYSWFGLNSSTGVLTINSTRDNQTGRFNISLWVGNLNQYGEARPFYFIVNATNDAPNFTSIQSEYNLTQAQLSSYYINASDEERQYPLIFNISFVNCSYASFSTRGNCSLFNLSGVSNTSSIINFTPSQNDVGVYYANISVMDSSNLSSCNSSYCTSNYFINKTTYYSQLVSFNIFSNFEVNVSDCEGDVFQQGSPNICNITIYSKGQNDTLNLSSYAILRNYDGTVSNRSWFYANASLNSSNFSKVVMVNMTPNVTEIGNWTINFSVRDLNYNLLAVEPIHILVNRTINNLPDILSIANMNTSISLLTTINITVYDEDFLIPDKNHSFGGFNETVNFSVRIMNQSNLAQELSLSNFTPVILNMPVSGTNRSLSRITFTPNSSESGNYTINLSASDREGAVDTIQFNLTIINNDAPLWNNTLNTNLISYEGNNTYLNLSKNVTDPNSDNITFSYSNDTYFKSFSLNSSTGIVNFTSLDEDVGQHIVSISANDSWLLNSSSFNFTIYNVNETPFIRTILQSHLTNATLSSGIINCSEGDFVQIELWVEDDDFKIPSGQKSFYNENLTLSLAIVGSNTSLLNFAKNTAFPVPLNNLSKFNASFLPTKNDVGNYNITINITDNSGLSTSIILNLSVIVFPDPPVLITLSNRTSAINRNLVYQINASDDEDGNSNITGGNSNFTFNYSFLSGTDFILHNESIFNSTTGMLNYTFNSSQGGAYRLNITVNDSTDRQDFDNFWINVYDSPTISYPNSSYQFSLSENQTSNLTFTVNHSMNNNLTYFIYFDNWNGTNYLVYSTNYHGNNTNLTFEITPNFYNETNGTKNLTLIAYPSDINLDNRESVNITSYRNLTINHTNYPINFSSNIGGDDGIISSSSSYSLNINDSFTDVDVLDSLYNQTISFNYTSHTQGCPMTVNISNWTNRTIPTMNFSSTTTTSCNFTITGSEYNESNSSQILNIVNSNNFEVGLTIEVQTITNTVTSSTSSVRKSGLKVITPGLIYVYPFQTISFPITLRNSGQISLNSITITTKAFKDDSPTDFIDVMLNQTTMASLEAGKEKNITVMLLLKTNVTGDYSVLINATPSLTNSGDWGKVYFKIGEINDTEVKKYLLFVEEFLGQNIQCIELKEYIKTAYDYFNQGNYGSARLKAEEALNACKNLVQEEKAFSDQLKPIPRQNLILYLSLSILLSFCLGLGYYFVKRQRIKNGGNIKIYED